jgi:glutamyl-tRNA reductase
VPSNLSFHVVGVSHHTAAVQAREPFAFGTRQVAEILKDFYRAGRSALLLSTCNRCELYWAGPGDGEAWFQDLARDRGVPIPRLLRYRDIAAIRHLFLVSSGIDSQILGETEILGQVRRAYDAARAAGTTTRQMDLIFSAALSAGRRVRRETLVGRHPASVSSAAVDLAGQRLGNLGSRNVVVLGAGEMGEGILRALQQQGARQVSLLSRHPEKARVLAAAWSAKTGDLLDLPPALERADLVILAMATSAPVVTADQLRTAVQARSGPSLLVMDLGLPRNVSPEARGIEGIELVDLDDLQALCCPATAATSAGLAEAEAVLEEELLRLRQTLRGRDAAPRLAELHRTSLQMAEQESAWALARLESLSEAEREIVRQMAERLVRRVLYPVSRTLREE